MNWNEMERQQKAAAARQQMRTELERRLENCRWYLSESGDCTERSRQQWRDIIAELERDLAEL